MYFKDGIISNNTGKYIIKTGWNCYPSVKVTSSGNIFMLMDNFYGSDYTKDIIDRNEAYGIRFIIENDGWNGCESVGISDMSFGFIGYNGFNKDYKTTKKGIVSSFKDFYLKSPNAPIDSAIASINGKYPGVYKLGVEYCGIPKLVADSYSFDLDISGHEGQLPAPMEKGDVLDGLVTFDRNHHHRYQVSFWRNDVAVHGGRNVITSPLKSDILIPFVFIESLPHTDDWEFGIRGFVCHKPFRVTRTEKVARYLPITKKSERKNQKATKPKK